jgi:hypothetical protein
MRSAAVTATALAECNGRRGRHSAHAAYQKQKENGLPRNKKTETKKGEVEEHACSQHQKHVSWRLK